jgi:hypothetical protein
MPDCIHNNNCDYQNDCGCPDNCRQFKPKPVTQADRIRAMTDEALAKERIIRKFGLFVAIDKPDIYYENKEEAIAAELAWLKSDAERKEGGTNA